MFFNRQMTVLVQQEKHDSQSLGLMVECASSLSKVVCNVTTEVLISLFLV